MNRIKKTARRFHNLFRVPADVKETVQDSVPIWAVHEKENIIESYPGCYVKCYKLTNINYQTATEDEQDSVLTKWRAYLNSLGNNQEMQLTIFNRAINMRQFKEEVLLKEAGDGFDDLRKQMNEITTSRIMEGKNGIRKDAYVTISVHADAGGVFGDGKNGISGAARGSEFGRRRPGGGAESGNAGFFGRIKGRAIGGLMDSGSEAAGNGYVNKGKMNGGFGSEGWGNRENRATRSRVYGNLMLTVNVFGRVDADIDKHLKGMGSGASVVPVEDWMEIIHDIYNMDHRGEFLIRTKIVDEQGRTQEVSSFDLENLRRMGLTVADVVGPSSMRIMKDRILMGTQIVRVLRIEGLPAILSDAFLTDLTNMPFSMLTTLTVKPLSNAQTDALINSQLAFIREEKNNFQKANRRDGVTEDMIPPQIIERENEVLELRAQIRENDEHLFETSLCVVVFASTEEELAEYTDSVISECKKASVVCEVLTDMQEEGLIEALPLCAGRLPNQRTLKSSSVAIFEPFSNLEIMEPGGIIYTMNAVSKNLIMFDRLVKANYNAMFLGSSGSGKSFAVKTEVVLNFLARDVDQIIIDVEQEYVYTVIKLGGQVIPIMPGGKYHINPLDIADLEYEFDESSALFGDTVDPILEKVSFIMKLFEVMVNKSWGMDSIQKTLIDECLRDLYKPFMRDGRLFRAPEPEETPTLNDMMEWFSTSKVPEARELYYTLKRFAGDGSFNIFSGQTNVVADNRLVCFYISQVGEELKLMAMTIIQDAMWGRLSKNRRISRYTYIYIDEIHLYFAPGQEASAQFIASLYKRARKYGGACTGITQNVSDMIDHPVAKKIISECSLVIVLNQPSEEAREAIKSTLNLSDSMMRYIISAPVGQGIFYTGEQAVPFYSRFPKDNDIYPLLTSNMTEILEIREKERREVLKEKMEGKKGVYGE